MTDRIVLDGDDLTLEEVGRIASGSARASLGARAAALMSEARGVIETILREGRPTYGVNTGFGHLADVRIPPKKVRDLQVNLIRSHAAGVGEPLGERETRAIMLLRAQGLALGHTGARPEIARRLLAALNAGLLPRIPSQGSVGASGDLAPLAHLALALIGEGEMRKGARFVGAARALRAAGLEPLRLEAKEGLALINGTQVTTAIGVLALLDSEDLLRHADLAGAMTIEALKGSARPFDDRVQRVRPHKGQQISARNVRRLLSKSEIMDSHRNCGRIQDSYALRCIPQVHGAGRSALRHIRDLLEIEVNSSTDNPLVFATRSSSGRGSTVSAGNFHAQPIASALDYLALALTSVSSISERRTERLVNPHLSGLPAFLVEQGGLHSGFMIAQVTAAALVSENKTLSHPASVDSIPTSANREDHVSMGPIAARKAARVVENFRRVLSIEILAATQGLDFLKPLKPSQPVRRVYRRIRRDVSFLEADRVLARDIEAVERMIVAGDLLRAAEGVTGPLD